MSSRKTALLPQLLLLSLPPLLYAEKSVYIDLSLQRLYAMENGKTVFESPVSSGQSGYETPTGRFTILQKERTHVSNLYPKPNGGAKMPYMMRLTWDGVAMHQGYVPNYPASHGCIRLPRRSAKKLFYWVEKGTPVTIAGDTGRYIEERMELDYSKDTDGYSIIEVY